MSALADHLRFYEELGVTGLSRDPAWQRPTSAPGAEASPLVVLTATPPSTLAPDPVPAIAAAIGVAAVATQPATLHTGETLDAIRLEIGPDCTRCKLHTLGRRQVVYGVGNPQARLMFVGEAPGEDEDRQGEPFVGKAGQLLTKIIEAMGHTRDTVYIANVIKCRPPGNRNPEPDEVASCEPFLFRQIDVIKPQVVVTLGKFAAQSLLKTTEPITRLRGRLFTYRGAQLMPTFHPAYLLRTPSAKREVWEDMKKVLALLQDGAADQG